MTSVKPRHAAGDLGHVFEFLSHGLIHVDGRGRVVSANVAARRHFHPTALRKGQPLPEPWADVSLTELVASAYREDDEARRPRLAEKAHGSDDRTFAVTVFAPDSDGLALIHIEETSSFERRARAEREFVANAAHELLTPLTGIVGAAHVLESGAKAVPETRDRFLRHIARECDRLARLARALLVLARAQSGQEPPRPDAIAVREVLTDAIRDAQAADAVDVRTADGVAIFADRDLVVLALTNVIANALRHAPDATIEASVVEVGRNAVEIQIADRGHGIDREQLSRLHERFASASGRDGTGFGLGLAIAAQAIEATGGRLFVDAGDDTGTRVRVWLPGGV